jgi:hypothetical protein
MVGALGVVCVVAAPAFHIQTPEPFKKWGNALPTTMFGELAVVFTVVVALMEALDLGIPP